MTTIISEVYEALISAGVDPVKAIAAAKAITNNDNRFIGIERKIAEFDGRFALLQWMVGFNLTFTMAVVWKIFR